jgi:anti-anti-sigma factor
MRVIEKDDRRIVQAQGDLDLSHAQTLRTALEGAMSRGEGDVVLDLLEANYIDSAILQELIRAHNVLSKQDRQFVVLAKSDSQPGQVLRTVMFHTIMPIYEDWDRLKS